jgi:uncharacterized phage protein (TIGR02218 family)
MATYSTHFGGYTTDAAPSDWTARWATAGSTWTVRADAATTGGKYLEHTRTTTDERLLSWDAIDSDANRDNAEIFVRFRSSTLTSGKELYLVLRGSGAATTETGYVFYNVNQIQVRVAKFSGGTLTTIATLGIPSLVSNSWYSVRFRVNGSDLKAKIWASEHVTEPAGWDIETTDATITGAGWVGVGNRSASGTRKFDDVAVGTNGDTAAFPASDSLRGTQYAALILGEESAVIDTRATQITALALIEPAAGSIRATQIAALNLVEFFADTRATQVAALALVDHVPCVTRWAQTWTITRTDGQVFAFTSLDRPLLFRGVWHQPCASLSATATEQSTAIGSTGSMELLGIISDAGISERDLYNGLFDFARFEIWMVPWNNAGGEIPFRLLGGTTGSMTQGDTGFKFEVLTPAAELKQKGLLETYSPGCRYNFGTEKDPRCPVSLAPLTVTGSATGTAIPAAANAATRRVFTDSSRAEADGYFDLGLLTWTSGNNNGASSEVKRFEGGTFVLWSPLLFPIESGDTYSVSPGCDKTTDGHLRYNADLIDFGGFPDVPGSDSINLSPDNKG